MDQKKLTAQEQIENVLTGVKGAYQFVAVRHVHPWYVWVLLALVIGFAGGALYVTNQSGSFDASQAAVVPKKGVAVPVKSQIIERGALNEATNKNIFSKDSAKGAIVKILTEYNATQAINVIRSQNIDVPTLNSAKNIDDVKYGAATLNNVSVQTIGILIDGIYASKQPVKLVINPFANPKTILVNIPSGIKSVTGVLKSITDINNVMLWDVPNKERTEEVVKKCVCRQPDAKDKGALGTYYCTPMPNYSLMKDENGKWKKDPNDNGDGNYVSENWYKIPMTPKDMDKVCKEQKDCDTEDIIEKCRAEFWKAAEAEAGTIKGVCPKDVSAGMSRTDNGKDVTICE